MNADMAGKYLTFQLADEDYGIALLKVKEIIGMMPITTVPRTPDFVQGVINLRGEVIPVTDLRIRFEMPATEYTDRTCIIVVEIEGAQGMTRTGVIVDAVSEVLNVPTESVEKAPSFGTHADTDYILGMVNMDGGVKILLDIDGVFQTDELAALAKAA